MGAATFTFRVDETLKNDFVTEAKARDRSLREQVQKGLDAANAGDVISSDEVESEAKAWRARTRQKAGVS